MAQSYVQLNTDGSGKKMDTVVTATAAQHRSVVVIGDPNVDGGVAPVDAVNGVSFTQATKLDPVNDGITSYPFGHSYTNITTNATTTMKSGSGVLRSIKVNNPSAITVAALTITVYDNTAGSGTKIATITVPIDTSAKPFIISFESAFTTGLTIVTAGPTVTADLTVEYR